ncbi:hypothetical protein [Rhodovulum strictum]|uniref:Uncharacterized protein n=1 Tax=Rhodovulum strictum TaxID=58314 RepID=A0A844B0B2_9RHOB|nr:hypothetical protein [Rhodovulum strictum]MRH19816.1 hypothetical protein [Rhodovulum strictum]
MPRFFLAPLLAASIALTPVAAAPARAADDLAKILLGAAAVYVIVDKLESNRRSANRVETNQAAGWYGPRGHDRHRVIPASCVRSVDTRRGSERIVTERCLRNEGIRRLPDRCEISVRGPRGSVDAYRLSCLQNAGYRVEGRRR